ncbi:hypothetical protein G7046_g282 [Stylonectria norvegica]|nr:hypothetical protein G7046_g282 [Stylonectria norvegica]
MLHPASRPPSSSLPKLRRPNISSPIGPVKFSRGPDLTRSSTLTIVPGIKDCTTTASSSPLLTSPPPDLKTTRRVSAGFHAPGPLASSPTVAKSPFNVCSVPGAAARPLRKMVASEARGGLTTSLTFDLLPRMEDMVQDENVPPSADGVSSPLTTTTASTPVIKSQLPKSRTMSVLHDLKTSISRPSLTARSVNSRSFAGSSRKTSSSSTTSTFVASSTSRLRLPRPSLTSLSRSSRSTSPEPLPQQIATAQPSAYWTGRFVALQDRFLSENLASNTLPSPLGQVNKDKASTTSSHPKRPSFYRPSHLSHSTTTSALLTLASPRSPPPSDDETRHSRIFNHLDALCTTSEARRSLHDFQQAYARRIGRPALLPHGGCMEDKGLITRLFGGGGRGKPERRSMSALRETSNVGERGPAAAKKKKTSMPGKVSVGGRGKRLTMY